MSIVFAGFHQPAGLGMSQPKHETDKGGYARAESEREQFRSRCPRSIRFDILQAAHGIRNAQNGGERMDLVLIRHAAAAETSPGLDDRSRELTPRGVNMLRQAMPRLQKHIKPGSVQIWSSPAVRALQTARIIAEKLKAKGVSTFDWIYTGDDAAFRDELQRADRNATVLIVGHLPPLGEWCGQLSGETVLFRKNGMAGLSMEGEHPARARLQWLFRASLQTVLDTPPDKSGLLLDCKHETLVLLKKLSKTRLRFLRRPDDPESAHQMRVSVKQARSLLSFVRPAVADEDHKGSQASLKALADRFSHVREVDVLLAQLRSLTGKEKGGPGLQSLKKFLKKERRAGEAALCDYLSDNSFEELLNDVSSRVRHWDGPGYEPAQSGPLLLKRYEYWCRNAARALESLDTGYPRLVHRLRIRLKKLSAVHALLRLPPPGEGTDPANIKPLERILGGICDTYAGVSLLQRLGSRPDAGKLKAETDAFAELLERRREKLTGKLEAFLPQRQARRFSP